MAAIVQADIKFRLSTKSGTQGNSTAAGAAGTSLGRFISTTDLGTTNLFPDITGAQNAAGQVDYQCVFIYNTNTANAMQNAVAWMPSANDVAGGATVLLGVDPTGASAANSTSDQAVAIANSTTAPAGVTIATAPSADSTGGVSLGNIPAGNCKAVWIKRTATNSTALNNDGFTLEVDFDTAAN